MQNGTDLAWKLPMRQHITASIALKTSNGMRFGKAAWIQDDRIAYSSDADFTPGERAELRMELSGQYQAVLAEILVIKTYPIDEKGEIGCVAQIMDMPAADSQRLTDWLHDLTDGGTTSQPAAWLQSILRQKTGSATPEETRAALNRMAGHRKGASHSASVSTSERLAGRAAVREALRASLTVEKGGLSEVTATPAEEPVTAPASNGAILDGVNYQIEENRIKVRWSKATALAQAWESGLKSGRLEIPLMLPGTAENDSVNLRFHLPDGQILALRARVLQCRAQSMDCSVNVPWGARVKLINASKG